MKSEAQQAYEKCRERLLSAPGMIEEKERRLLFKAAYNCPDLPVVEFGTFFGASALALASGLAARNLNPHQIICIDAFEVSKDHRLHKHVMDFAKRCNGIGLLTQDDQKTNWLRITQAVLGEHLERAKLVPGIVDSEFNTSLIPERIGLLHLDLPKDARTIEPILKGAIPRLLTNSVIVFQDYAYQFSNELIAFFELLEQNGHLQAIDIAASSIYYRVTSQDPESVDWGSILRDSLDKQCALIASAIKRYETYRPHRGRELIALKGAAIRAEATNKLPANFEQQRIIQRYIQEMMGMDPSHAAFILAELFTEEIAQHH